MGDNPVYKAVAKLRRALGDEAGEPRYIETIPRKGYRLLLRPEPLLPSPAAVRQSDQALPSGSAVAAQQNALVPAARLRVGRRVALGGTGLAVALLAIAAFTSEPWKPDAHARPVPLSVAGEPAPASLDGLPLEARQLYWLGRGELRDRRLGFALRLRQTAERLTLAAPHFAAGHALRSVACSFRAVYARHPSLMRPGFTPIDGDEALQCARQSARRALESDPASAQALAAAGFLAYVEAWNCDPNCDSRALFDSAQTRLERAVQLDPALPEAHAWLGMVYQQRGELDLAARQARASMELDPLNPVATVNANRFLLASGENARVRERLVALTQRPDAPPIVYAQLVDNAFAAGNLAEARRWTMALQKVEQNRAVQQSVEAALARHTLDSQAARGSGPPRGSGSVVLASAWEP
jgi:tetratricopeptide (TPR) repeat protein